MSNRNFDASTIIKILKVQNAANNHNRFQTLTNSSVNQLAPNPQTEHFDAEVVTEYAAGSQTYYFQGFPTMTSLSPVLFPSIASTTSGPAPAPVPILVAPTITSITPGNQELLVNYSNTNTGTVTGYFFSVDGGATFNRYFQALIPNALLLTGLTGGVSYSVQIQVEVNGVTSPASTTAVGTPYSLPGAPMITSIVPGNTQLEVFFTDGSAGTSFITNYAYSVDGSAGPFTQFDPSQSSSPLFITGLMNGSTYTIVIQAITQDGSSPSSNEVTGTPFILPGAPMITQIIPGNSLLEVFFTDGSAGSRPIINYAYSRTGHLGTFTQFDPSQNSSPVFIPDLSNNISYNIAIDAITLDGSSNSSNDMSGIPLAVPPPPLILSVITGVTVPGEATVYFSQAPYYPDISGYSYSLNGGPFVPASTITSPITITGLNTSTTYSIVLRGTTGFATSGNSNTVSIYTTTAATTHTFFAATTWTPPSGVTTVDYLVVGGGGGGGGAYDNAGGGGGGAGLYLSGTLSSLDSSYPITVGTGGAGGQGRSSVPGPLINTSGSAGASSSFGSVIAAGGGAGLRSRNGNSVGGTQATGLSGGGGGGGGGGGKAGGGGGGNGSAGQTKNASGSGGTGGSSVSSSISGVSVLYGAGGAGGSNTAISGGVSGTPYTGNGGGGVSLQSTNSSTIYYAGNGGAGIVILSY